MKMRIKESVYKILATIGIVVLCFSSINASAASEKTGSNKSTTKVDLSGQYSYKGIKFRIQDSLGHDAVVTDGKDYSKAKLNLEELKYTNEYSSIAETLLGKYFTWTAFASKIGKNAFKGNNKIKTIEGNLINLKKIEGGAFQNMTNLKEIDLGYTSLKSIGSNAFAGDKNLNVVKIDVRHLKSIGKDAFKGTPSGICFVIMDPDSDEYDFETAAKEERKNFTKSKKKLSKLLKRSGLKNYKIICDLDY